MIDPLLSLALTMHSNKGIYALLIGSGVSRGAQIPTGWEIVLDLIRKLAHIKGQDCEPDPAAWYKAEYEEMADYSKLLNAISKSPTERQQLLKAYFEPTPDERAEGLKLPTKAHIGIAELVAKGYVRVIITTNFDRLIEKALEQAGIAPTVISTIEAIEGALPLIHSACTVIKVHGDYLDTRIKNTIKELKKYDEPLNKLLDRIFDEFGLIVCGWSAEWDVALRAAFERCPSHRFTTYWTARVTITEAAQKLITLRRALKVAIKDADSFFDQLAAKISALEEISQPHPLSIKMAVANLKTYLVEDRHRIRLHDLLWSETEKLASELNENNFPLTGVSYSPEELVRRLTQYEAFTSPLLSLMTTGCYFGKEEHQGLWIKCLERIANLQSESRGLEIWRTLNRYPALQLLYGCGIALLASRHYVAFAALLTQTKIRTNSEEDLLIFKVLPNSVLLEDKAKILPNRGHEPTPFNLHLESVLREPFKGFLHDEIKYQHYFDKFEYLLALSHADLLNKQCPLMWGPTGCFRWRDRRNPGRYISTLIEAEVQAEKENWPLLKAGLFDGSVERFFEVKNSIDNSISHLPWD